MQHCSRFDCRDVIPSSSQDPSRRRKHPRGGGERFFPLVAPLSIPLPSAFRRLLPRTFTKGRSFSLPRRYVSPFFLAPPLFHSSSSFPPLLSTSFHLFSTFLSLYRRLIERPVGRFLNCERCVTRKNTSTAGQRAERAFSGGKNRAHPSCLL